MKCLGTHICTAASEDEECNEVGLIRPQHRERCSHGRKYLCQLSKEHSSMHRANRRTLDVLLMRW
jgi:hypothetical protein